MYGLSKILANIYRLMLTGVRLQGPADSKLAETMIMLIQKAKF